MVLYNYVAGVYTSGIQNIELTLVSFIGFYDLFGAVPRTDPLIVVPINQTTEQETDSDSLAFFEVDL